MMRWYAILTVALVLPLSALATGASEALAPTDSLTVDAGSHLALRPDDGGWGRLTLVASEDVSLTMTLEHDTMEDLETFTNDGEGIYDEHHYTYFHLFRAGEGAYSNHWFNWWGTPVNDWWPSYAWEFEEVDPLHIPAGDTAIVVVGNNVPGYTIHITAQAAGAPLVHEWTLGPHPGLLVKLPVTDETTDLGIAGSEQLLYEEDVTFGQRGIITAVSYDIGEDTGADLQMHDAHWHAADDRTTPAQEVPGMSLGSGTGSGYSASASMVRGEVPSGDYTLHGTVLSAFVRTGGADGGVQFLLLPVEG